MTKNGRLPSTALCGKAIDKSAPLPPTNLAVRMRMRSVLQSPFLCLCLHPGSQASSILTGWSRWRVAGCVRSCCSVVGWGWRSAGEFRGTQLRIGALTRLVVADSRGPTRSLARHGRSCLVPLSRVYDRPLLGHRRFPAPDSSLSSRCRGLLRVEQSWPSAVCPALAARRSGASLIRSGEGATEAPRTPRVGCWTAPLVEKLWKFRGVEVTTPWRVQGLGFSQFSWDALP